MPLLETKGAASAQGFGLTLGGAAPVYIEDVFSTWLYTGNSNGSTPWRQTITNGIDLSTKGGLVWLKGRSGADSHCLYNTNNGVTARLSTDSTSAANNQFPFELTDFNSNGFTIGSGNTVNRNGDTYASWTFRKQPKFFDVVTWTGNDASTRSIPHSLGSAPGCVMIKAIDSDSGRSNGYWIVNHRSLPSGQSLLLPLTSGSQTLGGYPSPFADSTTFTVTFGTSNTNGVRYVAYLFAHNAGGFGLTGTDNVISCGSYTGTGAAGNAITLGYEPQWVLIKRTDSTGSWGMTDTMRGMSATNNLVLYSDLSNAELDAGSPIVFPTATGFTCGTGSAGWNASGGTYIYIAIRRGPMRTPTSGTSVYENTAYTGNGASNRQIGSSVLTDLLMLNNRDATAQSWSTYAQMFFDRLRGDNVSLATANTNAESGGWNSYIDFDMNAGWDTGPTTQQTYLNNTSSTFVSHIFRRAPGFLDVVCYTGDGTDPRSITHNLTATPELMIVKRRDAAANWRVYGAATGATNQLFLNLTDASAASAGAWSNTAPTSSAFTVGFLNNSSGATYVAYLFATVAGVSRVGSYTGNGSSQTINMGFTGGARFFLVKRTDSTGDWWVYDAARGMSGLNDPALRLNSSVAETVSGSDAVSTTSVGLIVSQDTTCNINVNGATYIYLGIA